MRAVVNTQLKNLYPQLQACFKAHQLNPETAVEVTVDLNALRFTIEYQSDMPNLSQNFFTAIQASTSGIVQVAILSDTSTQHSLADENFIAVRCAELDKEEATEATQLQSNPSTFLLNLYEKHKKTKERSSIFASPAPPREPNSSEESAAPINILLKCWRRCCG